MAKLSYLLDLPVLAELTRPTGNRRVFTLFARHHAQSALAAPSLYALLRGVEALHAGERREQLQRFVQELWLNGPAVLAFDREAAIWLAAAAADRIRVQRNWSALDGQLAAIAATRDLVLVTRNASAFSGLERVRVEDWFRP